MQLLACGAYRSGLNECVIWEVDTETCRVKPFVRDRFWLRYNDEPERAFWGIKAIGGLFMVAGGSTLSIYNHSGQLVARRTHKSLSECHAVCRLRASAALVANTGHDEIVAVNPGSLLIEGSWRVRGHFRGLRDKSVAKPYALNISHISERRETIYVTHMFTCRRSRLPWRKRVFAPGGVVTLDGERVIRDVPGAHDGIWAFRREADDLYLNASHVIETRRYSAPHTDPDNLTLAETWRPRIGGLLRGMVVSPDRLFVGLTRIDPSRTRATMYEPIARARGVRMAKRSGIITLKPGSNEIHGHVPIPNLNGVGFDVYSIIQDPRSR